MRSLRDSFLTRASEDACGRDEAGLEEPEGACRVCPEADIRTDGPAEVLGGIAERSPETDVSIRGGKRRLGVLTGDSIHSDGGSGRGSIQRPDQQTVRSHDLHLPLPFISSFLVALPQTMENKRAATQKYMKQTTLFDYGSSPMKAPPKPWGISSKPSKRTQEDPAAPNTPVLKIKKPRKKKRKYSSDESGSESSNSDNIRRIKLESKEPIEISSSSSDSHSGSGESEDEVDAPPITTPAKRFEKLRAYVDSEDKEDEEDSPQPTRRRLKKGRPRSSEDIEDEETGHKRRRLTRERKTGVKGEEDNDTEDVDDLDPEREWGGPSWSFY